MPVLLPFALLSIICIVAPGPDNLSVIACGISAGRRAGICFGAGCAAGCLLHTFWLCIGVSALVAASAAAFLGLKIAGAGYLFYLSILAFRSGRLAIRNTEHVSGSSVQGWPFFRRGFLANALNPKVALSFLAFLPQFVRPGAGSTGQQILLLGIIFAFLTLAIFGAIGFFSGTVGRFLQRNPWWRTWLDRLTGVIFLALGLGLLFAHLHRNP